MAKGKITQYKVDSFSPAAVGTPRADLIGRQIAEEVGGGIARAGANIGKILGDVAAKQDAASDVAAMSKFGDYQAKYEIEKEKLFLQYQNKPSEFPQAVKDLSGRLTEEYSKDLSGDVLPKFKKLSVMYSAREGASIGKMVADRETELQVSDAKNVYSNLALMGTKTKSPEALANLLQGFEFAEERTGKLIGADSSARLKEEYRKVAIQNALNTRVHKNPAGLLRDLDAGKYDGIVPVTEIVSFKEKAQRAIYNRDEYNLYNTLYQAQGKLLDIQEKVDNRQISVGELVAEKNAALARKEPQSYVNTLDTFIDQITFSTTKTDLGRAEGARVLDEVNKEWDAYLNRPGGVPSDKDLDKELDLFGKLTQAYHQNFLTRPKYEERVALMKSSYDFRAKNFERAVNEAGEKKMFFWRVPADDVVSHGYRYVKDFVDKSYSTLSDSARMDLKMQMMSQYHQMIKSTPKDILDKIQTSNEKDQFARKMIMGQTNAEGEKSPGILSANMRYSDPKSGKTLYPGDAFVNNDYGVPVMFSGLNPDTGDPIFELGPNQKGKEVHGRYGSVAIVTGVDKKTGALLLGRKRNGQ